MKLTLALSLLVVQLASRAPSGTLSGQLRASNGAPAAGVRVAVTAVEAKTGFSAVSNLALTDDEGRYRLDDVPPGRYLILAGALTSPVYFPGVTAQENGQIVTVAAGQTISNLDFTLIPALPPPPILTSGNRIGLPWTIRMDDGSPVPGVAPMLSVEFLINGNSRTVCCRGAGPSAGPLRLFGFVSGANTVVVSKVPLGYYVKSITFEGADLNTAPLVLPEKVAGAQIEVVLTKNPLFLIGSRGFKISGRVTNLELPKSSNIGLLLKEISSDGKTVSIGTANNEMSVWADRKTGVFEIEGVPPGRYQLQFDNSVGSAQPLIIDVTIKDVANLELKFAPLPEFPSHIRPRTPVVLDPTALTAIHGTVAVAGGAAPEFEIEFVSPQDAGMNRTVKVSGREFTVELPPVEYRARIVNLQGYAVTSVAAGPLDLTEPFRVTSIGIADSFSGAPADDRIMIRLTRP